MSGPGDYVAVAMWIGFAIIGVKYFTEGDSESSAGKNPHDREPLHPFAMLVFIALVIAGIVSAGYTAVGVSSAFPEPRPLEPAGVLESMEDALKPWYAKREFQHKLFETIAQIFVGTLIGGFVLIVGAVKIYAGIGAGALASALVNSLIRHVYKRNGWPWLEDPPDP